VRLVRWTGPTPRLEHRQPSPGHSPTRGAFLTRRARGSRVGRCGRPYVASFCGRSGARFTRFWWEGDGGRDSPGLRAAGSVALSPFYSAKLTGWASVCTSRTRGANRSWAGRRLRSHNQIISDFSDFTARPGRWGVGMGGQGTGPDSFFQETLTRRRFRRRALNANAGGEATLSACGASA